MENDKNKCKWTANKVATMREMLGNGCTLGEIADAVDVDVEDVIQKAQVLEISLNDYIPEAEKPLIIAEPDKPDCQPQGEISTGIDAKTEGKYTKWTDHMDELLIGYKKERKSENEIARIMGMRVKQVRYRVQVLSQKGLIQGNGYIPRAIEDVPESTEAPTVPESLLLIARKKLESIEREIVQLEQEKSKYEAWLEHEEKSYA